MDGRQFLASKYEVDVRGAMGTFKKVKADDGHELGAYVADPATETRGRIVVIQEIFGVTGHIRNMCDWFADRGYRAAAPALYDRIERDTELDYDPAGFEKGLSLRKTLDPDHLDWVMLDVKATVDHLGSAGTVGIVGYCFGGLVAWLAACRLEMACASSYYGRTTEQYVNEIPKCPVICHFGERDENVPPAVGEAIKAAYPDVEVHIYPADHGFVCDERPTYDAASAQLAQDHTLELFARALTG